MVPVRCLACFLVVSTAAPAQLLTHRWSFNETGSAASGRSLPDRIGAAPAIIRGNNASLNGSAVTLPGTTNGNQAPQNIAAYVDLPNGILSSKQNATVEIWATVISSRSWQRLFDFGRVNIEGDGAPGEITGSGSSAPGGTEASDAFMLAVQRGSTANTQRFVGGLNGSETDDPARDTSATINFGTRYHFVATFESGVGSFADSGGGRIRWFLNGTQVTSVDLAHTPTDIEDVNNWLGRSQWNGDSNSNIAYDECRIYNGILSPAAITASRDAGPDADIPATLPSFALTMNLGRQVRIAPLAEATGEVVPTSLAIGTPPASGTAEVQADGTVLYTQINGAPETDGFTLTATNSSGQTATATVSITFESDLRFANPNLNVPAQPPATSYDAPNAFGTLTFSQPLCLVSPPGDTQRLFVCEKEGLLRMVPDVTANTPTATTFLDLPTLLGSRGESINTDSESGLLGLAFHPDYATNRHFYIFYSVDKSGLRYQRISRFTTQAGNPAAADTGSELILIEQRDESGNHNGGDLHFGPDGYLYISVGDEGAADDTHINSQRINKDLFSGILRIDVDKTTGNPEPTPHAAIPTDSGVARFSIPADNPFVPPAEGGDWDGTYNGSTVTGTVRREFWATGLRNPWRMSFDPSTGTLWCGDVGQGAREEIDIITRGGNYGWVFREGTLTGPRTTNPTMPASFDTLYHEEPVYEYVRTNNGDMPAEFRGNSVTGGLVYRGGRLAALQGKYVFGDYISGNIWSMDLDGQNVEFLLGEGGIAGFGSDPSNDDILMADLDSGIVRRITSTTLEDTFPTTLSATGLFADVATLSPAPGLLPYDVNLPFWSDHALKRRWLIVPDGTSTFTWAEEGQWGLPPGTIWVKHFDLETERGNPETKQRIETRLLVKNADGAYGVSYRWNEEETEAFLVPDVGDEFDLSIEVDGSPTTQTWRIPSRAECLTCHTPQAGHALSFNTRQLNREHDILGFTGNQLTTLSGQGFFSNPPPSPNLLPRHLRAGESDYSLEARVRSYLAVNCGYCHMEDGTAPTTWDGRPQLTLAETGLLLGEPNNNGGNTDNKLVVPGDTTHSVLLSRVSASNGFTRMPPIATNELDQSAIDLLTEWITTSLPGRQDYDAWRSSLFGSGTSPEGAADQDPDADGADNLDEFLAGTSPLDPGNRPQLALTVGEDLTLDFTLPENRSFRVMTSDDLQSWTPWDVAGNQGLPVNGDPVSLDAPLEAARRFFQLEVSEN